MTKPINALAENLRRLLEKHHLNPNSLAAALNNQVPQPTIQRIRNGEVQSPRDSTIQPIADYFGISVHALRFEEIPPNPTGPANPRTASASRMRTQKVPVVALEHVRRLKYLWGDDGRPLFPSEFSAHLATSDPHAFLVAVEDDEMFPRFKPGEYARVEPARVNEIEDEVLLRTNAGDVFLARLLARRGGRIRIGYYGQRKDDSFAVEDVTWVYAACNPVPIDDVGNF